jgi:8-oxo-dGTP pyrophosphatase MutT (NUDIX family)
MDYQMIEIPQLAAVVLFCTEDHDFVAVSRKGSTTLFGLPGGKVDAGESVEHAAVREIAEELQLTIAVDDLIPVYAGNDGDVWATAFLYKHVLTAAQIDLLVPEPTTVIRVLSRHQLSSYQVSPFAGYNLATFSAIDKFLKKADLREYSVELTTWENDADHYSTQTIRVASVDEARFLKELFFMFTSRNNGQNPGLGNSNVETHVLRQLFIEQAKEHNVQLTNIFERVEDIEDEDDEDSVIEILTQLLGDPVEYDWGFFGPGPFCRVAERFEVYRMGVLDTYV